MAARWDRVGKRSDSSSVISLMQRDMNSCFFSFFFGAGRGITHSFHQKGIIRLCVVPDGFFSACFVPDWLSRHPSGRSRYLILPVWRPPLPCPQSCLRSSLSDASGIHRDTFPARTAFHRSDQAPRHIKFLFIKGRVSPFFRDFPDFVMKIKRLEQYPVLFRNQRSIVSFVPITGLADAPFRVFQGALEEFKRFSLPFPLTQ